MLRTMNNCSHCLETWSIRIALLLYPECRFVFHKQQKNKSFFRHRECSSLRRVVFHHRQAKSATTDDGSMDACRAEIDKISTFHINVVCRSHFLRVSHACHLASLSLWMETKNFNFLSAWRHDDDTTTRSFEASSAEKWRNFFSLVKIYIYGILYIDDRNDGRPRPELMMMMKTNFIIFVSMREVVE